jgi:peptidoglycan hydrolase-like protein with peptidoglycan-binding domain
MNRTRSFWLAALMAGCAHSTDVGQERSSARTQPEQGERPVAARPQQLLRTGGVSQLQSALAARGYVTPRNGTLDDRTSQAIEKFQRDHDLAPTGKPDLATLDKLGLDPARVLRYGSTATR